jgi:hypothetical protein
MATQTQAGTLTIESVTLYTKVARPFYLIKTKEGLELIRNPRAMVIEASNANLVEEDTVTKTSLGQALDQMTGGTVSGTFTMWEKGDLYEVTENSRCIIDSEHPHYGKYKVGDKAPAIKADIKVEGFLSIKPPQSYYIGLEVAKQQAILLLSGKIQANATPFDAFLNRAKALQDKRNGIIPIEKPATDDDFIDAEFTGQPKAKTAKK